MCGIAGIAANKDVDPSVLSKMVSILRHRGPDDEGFFLCSFHGESSYYRGNDTICELSLLPHIELAARTEKGFNVGLAHRRLSIIDLSDTGHQPMQYLNGKYTIVFNGEIYNYKEIRSQLAFNGYQFLTASDTEVILAAYDCWGMDCMSHFIGMWAFAIWDRQNQKLVLSRDRFGIKPLYYHHKNDVLFFASEIKALISSGCAVPIVDQHHLFQYLSFSHLVNPNNTLFEGVFEVPEGFNLVYYPLENRLEHIKYYDLTEAFKNCRINNDDPVNDFEYLFDDAMRFHLRADVPIGSCLSGGLDSSAIVAFSARNSDVSGFKTFTAKYLDPMIDESDYASMVASSFPNVHDFYAYPNAKGFWTDFEKLIWHQDLPIHSTSIYAQWEVMKLAGSQKMKVLLDGQGSDEILGGYDPFAGMYLLNFLKKGRFLSFLSEARLLKNNWSLNLPQVLSRAAFYDLPQFAMKRLRKKTRLGQKFIDHEVSRKYEKDLIPEIITPEFSSTSINSIKYGLHELLRYEDRNSMAFSIESRVPFLDHRVVEYSIALSDHWKIKEGYSKFILRKIIENKLPLEVVWRKDKKGFITPQEEWKKDINPLIRTYLSDQQLPEFFNRKFILNSLNTDFNNKTHSNEFWKLLTILKWIDLFHIRFIH